MNSAQQDRALEWVARWLKQKDQQVFRLFGYAGTGKTTLAKEIAAMVKAPVFAAYTGKAASVMRKKGCTGAQTIHSLIYEVKDANNGDPVFKRNKNSIAKVASLIIIDECSMVDEQIGKDLLSFGTKILVLGDPAQLPPIEGAGFFTSHPPDYMLTEVHRQAAENPIIRLSMDIRDGKRLAVGDYGETRVITRKDVNAEIVLGADQVIVGMNRTRQQYNARIRELRNLPKNEPVKGDRLICLRNDKTIGVFNGSMWNINDVSGAHDMRHLSVESPDEPEEGEKEVMVYKNFFDGTEGSLDWRDKKGTQEFTFGYAVTCHKSQGSQWNNVTVFDESRAFSKDQDKWLYTAATRAAEKLTLVVSQ